MWIRWVYKLHIVLRRCPAFLPRASPAVCVELCAHGVSVCVCVFVCVAVLSAKPQSTQMAELRRRLQLESTVTSSFLTLRRPLNADSSTCTLTRCCVFRKKKRTRRWNQRRKKKRTRKRVHGIHYSREWQHLSGPCLSAEGIHLLVL